MVDTEAQAQYRRDASVLAALGSHFATAKLPDVEVRMPRALADTAVAAWERDDEGPLDSEDLEQRIQRHRAASLALIGLSIVKGGRPDDGEVFVGLHLDLVGDALTAAEDLP
ncbi:hypothetical protein [Lacisediminihabitans sp. H27-G8]|uniref:hypothetical protein n=1 Tax=Lacisediminihabitans sp. H27-G8 TaxID=3111909 RepID=UPI0038FC8E20